MHTLLRSTTSDAWLRRLLLFAGLALIMGLLVWPQTAHAQEPTQRQLRTYIPPEQLVSFNPSTPFDTFIDFVNPIFGRVTGKTVLDPETRTDPIGVDIARMHFLDALEMVLDANGLTYRETDRYFIVEQRVNEVGGTAISGGADVEGQTVLPASLDTREIKINALFFELDLTRSRELGIDWNVFFGSGGGSSGGNTGGGSGTGGGQSGSGTDLTFNVNTESFFDRFGDHLDAPEQIDLTTLTQFFRLLENSGLGETIANPSITVQTDEEGRIQIGSDVPVQTRDFAGNTVTQFFSTGVIVDVVPTLISQPVADTLGSPLLDFIHMNVQVENSSTSPSSAGAPTINKSVATTQVLLLDGEQTIIGGLYSTDQTVARRGVPVLKDLPWWFFGLRYVFGYHQTQVVQKELMIVLQAEVMDPLRARAQRPFKRDLLEERRQEVRDALRRFNENRAQGIQLPSEQGSD